MAKKQKKVKRNKRNQGRSFLGSPSGASIGQPFPTVPEHLKGKVGVVTSQPFLQTPSPRIQTKTTVQAPTLTRRKQKQSESDRFCKVVINKKTGKRKRICRVKDVPIRKRKRSKGIADNIPTIPTPRLARFL